MVDSISSKSVDNNVQDPLLELDKFLKVVEGEQNAFFKDHPDGQRLLQLLLI
jgi:hypothetical protein